jgi:hypothetical protein
VLFNPRKQPETSAMKMYWIMCSISFLSVNNLNLKFEGIMNKKQFEDYWAKNYPETSPINYLFRTNLKDKWFRIHSLPNSKRYADTEEEYKMIADRQNTIIDDLIMPNAKIKVVINYIEISNPLFKKYDFVNLGVYVDKQGEAVFQSFLFGIKWNTNELDDLLKYIANDEMRAFIIGNNCLIAPYDGGMDIYLNDSETRDFYKNKYKEWLSIREDGY